MSEKKQHRFLFVSAPFSGIQVFMRSLKEVIDTMPGIRGRWMFIENDPPELLARIPPLSLNWTVKGGYVFKNRLKKLLSAGEKFDAVFVNHLIPARAVWAFGHNLPMVMSLDGTPVILEEFRRWYLRPKATSNRYIETSKRFFTRRVYQSCSYLLPWSENVKRSLRHDYSVEADKIKVLPPGININEWGKVPQRNPSPRKEVNVLFVGGEFYRKGGDLVLRMARRDEFKKCRFHIVTKSFVSKNFDNVFFYNALNPNSQEIRNLFRHSDIFLLPTRADLAPTNSIMEAMAMGLPVVTTDVGGLDETIQDGQSGFVIPTENEHALFSRLQLLVGSPEMRIKMGLRGRRVVEGTMDLHHNAETIIECLSNASTGNRT